MVIGRRTFNACQNILMGRNRRAGRPEIMLSGCVLRRAHCGYAINGEQIRRKLSGGGRSVHVYYKCWNARRIDGHPNVRWREQDVEDAIVKELDSIRIPDPNIQQWFRDAIEAAFQDESKAEAERRRPPAKRRAEVSDMRDRLLNAFLSEMADEAAFNAKSAKETAF